MKKILEINDIRELANLKQLLLETAKQTTTILEQLLKHKTGIDLFYDIRFLEVGLDPFGDRPLNLVEQLNQTFTYLTSLEATQWLIGAHPKYAPYILNLGTSRGFDIISKDGLVKAETFAATSPNSK